METVIVETTNRDLKLLTEEQKNKLVDLDLIFYNGRNWEYFNCEAIEEFFINQNIK